MLRNFIRQSNPWIQNVSPVLGRWKRNDNINRKIDLSNIDNCGDRVCGDLLPKPIVENNYLENIDSHDNSLYHNSLRNNYNYSIKSIVSDYNRRWKKNITIEEYLKEFTKKV